MSDQRPIDLSNVDFHEIARRGDTEVMTMFLEANLADLLLAHGADPALTDAQGRTAADYARANGYNAVAERITAAQS